MRPSIRGTWPGPQAMGLPASRGARPHEVLAAFVEEMKATGFVADPPKRHRIAGAIVAPAAI
ncbi:MAG TPA: hypothetical protein VGL63_05930 [Streptosporangiaceae bacterium]